MSADSAPNRSQLIDQAYDEYRDLLSAGAQIDVEVFCSKYPSGLRTSIYNLIKVDSYLCKNADLIEAPTPDLLADLPEADTFRGYKLLRLLGQGGFSHVFLAQERPELGGRLVVLKLTMEGAPEASLLARLKHPNIVGVYYSEHCPDSHLTALVMPYHGCATLQDVVTERKKLQESPQNARFILDAIERREERWAREACKEEQNWSDPEDRKTPALFWTATWEQGVAYLGAQLANALSYVHNKGVLHRDLKPENVLLTTSGRPMLLDFNLAWNLERLNRNTGGTIPYMAPEQLSEILHELRRSSKPLLRCGDTRSDIFALGVVLFELLTGEHPFRYNPSGTSHHDHIRHLFSNQLDKANQASCASPPMQRILSRCLAYHPEDRYQNAKDLEKDLKALYQPARSLRFLSYAGSLLALILFAFFVSGVFKPDLEERARTAFKDGDYQEAVNLLRRRLSQNPSNPGESHYLLARTLQKQGQFDLALSHYRRARESVDRPELQANYAYCHIWVRNYHQGVQLNKRAIAGGLQNAAIHTNQGFALLQLQRFKEAEHHLSTAIRLNPKLKEAWSSRAMLDYKLALKEPGRLPLRGFQDVWKARKIDPQSIRSCQIAIKISQLMMRRDPTNAPDHLKRIRECRQALCNLLKNASTQQSMNIAKYACVEPFND